MIVLITIFILEFLLFFLKTDLGITVSLICSLPTTIVTLFYMGRLAEIFESCDFSEDP